MGLFERRRAVVLDRHDIVAAADLAAHRTTFLQHDVGLVGVEIQSATSIASFTQGTRQCLRIVILCSRLVLQKALYGGVGEPCLRANDGIAEGMAADAFWRGNRHTAHHGEAVPYFICVYAGWSFLALPPPC